MAMDQFIKIGDIKGETLDKALPDHIDVLSWSWGCSNSGSAQMGAGQGAGKANCQNLTITKWLDSSTPPLQLACIKGTHIPESKLYVRKAGDKPLNYVIITLTDCLITSCSTGGNGGDDRLTESVTIDFAKMKLEYMKQKKDGTGEKGGQWEYSFAENA